MSRIARKYRTVCLVEFKDREIVEGQMSRDGLLFYFPHSLRDRLDSIFPYRDKYGWYWNETRDRYAAEIDAVEISVNPQVLYEHTTNILTEDL